MTDTPAPAPLTGSSWHTEMIDAPGYLAALGIAPAAPTAQLLAALHRAHVHTFPFANIDVLLGTHPGVTPDRVYDQLVVRRRGGYCFEHAQLFAAGAEHLGFRVRRTLGRVGSLAQWRTHMSVIVEVDGRQMLCDPGFGFALTAPLELRDGAAIDVCGREMSVHARDDDGTAVWELRRDGETQHFVDLAPVHPPDVRAGHYLTSTHPDSHFTRVLMVIGHTDEGHITVTASQRTLRTDGDPTEVTPLSTDEVLTEAAALGVRLDDQDWARLRAAIEDIRAREQNR